MPEITQPVLDMHSEAWWIRLLDDDLTDAERVRWRTHLQQCARCQTEWAALASVDSLLRSAAAPPALPLGFAAVTVERVLQQQRLSKMLKFLAGTLIVTLVAGLVFTCVGSALGALEQSLSAVVAARQVLFRSVVQTFLALFFGWRAMLPFVLGLLAVAYILLMPNGLMMTAALIWLSGRKRAAASAQV